MTRMAMMLMATATRTMVATAMTITVVMITTEVIWATVCHRHEEWVSEAVPWVLQPVYVTVYMLTFFMGCLHDEANMKRRPIHDANSEHMSCACIFNTFASSLLYRVNSITPLLTACMFFTCLCTRYYVNFCLC